MASLCLTYQALIARDDPPGRAAAKIILKSGPKGLNDVSLHAVAEDAEEEPAEVRRLNWRIPIDLNVLDHVNDVLRVTSIAFMLLMVGLI